MGMHTDGQGIAVALLVGFAVVVVVIHVVEFVWLALSVHVWLLSLAGVAAALTCCGGVVLYVTRQLHAGLRLDDALALVGAQLALTVCFPARFVRWRKYACQKQAPGPRLPVNAHPLSQRDQILVRPLRRSGWLGGRRHRN